MHIDCVDDNASQSVIIKVSKSQFDTLECALEELVTEIGKSLSTVKRIGKEEYAKEAESAYQQIVDLIDRFQKVDAAIVASNARTEITTSHGTFTVAGAISLRGRLRGAGAYDGEADFEGILQDKLKSEYNERVHFCATKNSQLQITAKNMCLGAFLFVYHGAL